MSAWRSSSSLSARLSASFLNRPPVCPAKLPESRPRHGRESHPRAKPDRLLKGVSGGAASKRKAVTFRFPGNPGSPRDFSHDLSGGWTDSSSPPVRVARCRIPAIADPRRSADPRYEGVSAAAACVRSRVVRPHPGGAGRRRCPTRGPHRPGHRSAVHADPPPADLPTTCAPAVRPG